jgi:hypothetical protein
MYATVRNYPEAWAAPGHTGSVGQPVSTMGGETREAIYHSTRQGRLSITALGKGG